MVGLQRGNNRSSADVRETLNGDVLVGGGVGHSHDEDPRPGDDHVVPNAGLSVSRMAARAGSADGNAPANVTVV